MPGAILDMLDLRLVRAGQLDDALHDRDVLLLVGPARVVHLAREPALEYLADRAGEVRRVDPVAHLHAIAVDRQPVAAQRVEDHQRDQLLGILVGPVVVGAATDRGGQLVRVEVALDQQVGARLGGRVGRGWAQRGLLGERARLNRAVYLVGRYLQEAELVCACRLQQHVGAERVRAHECVRVGDRAVHVRLRGEVHDRLWRARL